MRARYSDLEETPKGKSTEWREKTQRWSTFDSRVRLPPTYKKTSTRLCEKAGAAFFPPIRGDSGVRIPLRNPLTVWRENDRKSSDRKPKGPVLHRLEPFTKVRKRSGKRHQELRRNERLLAAGEEIGALCEDRAVCTRDAAFDGPHAASRKDALLLTQKKRGRPVRCRQRGRLLARARRDARRPANWQSGRAADGRRRRRPFGPKGHLPVSWIPFGYVPKRETSAQRRRGALSLSRVALDLSRSREYISETVSRGSRGLV